MKAPGFAYLRPASLDEALDALARFGDDAAILAGGQSLMAMHNLRVARAGVLVDINRIPGLDAIRDDGERIAIGCLARHAALEASGLIRRELPLFAQALPHVAHPAIRSRGTLGGSLALADPAAELPACCLALGATLIATGPGGRREIAAEDFFVGLYETALAPAEMLVEVHVPKRSPAAVQRFAEVARRRGDFALAGVAMAGAPASPRLALLGVDDRPLLARETMRVIEGVGAAVDEATLRAALAADADPVDEPGCPAAYRRHVVEVLVRRLLDDVAREAA